MNMLLIIGPENRKDEIQALIVKHDVHAYSELSSVTGEGKTGKKLGTRVWPERSVLIFTVVTPDKRDELVAALRAYRGTLFPEEGLKVFVMPAEAVL